MQGTLPYTPTVDDGRLEAEVKELICYLWDNYLQLYDAEEVFIVGVGYAYIGIKMLLLNRSKASPPSKLFLFGVKSNKLNPPTLCY